MEESFREFIQRPENQQILEAHQKKEALRALKAQENERAHNFQEKVLESEFDVQKAIAPFLKVPALRRVIQTFTNDEENDFQKWAGNQQVINMLTEAKRMLEEGRMSEAELEYGLTEYCQTMAEMGNPVQEGALKKTRMAIEQLVPALNEHLTQRRRGNDYFRKDMHEEAMQSYQRAKSILELVAGMSQADQAEVDANMATVHLNIAAVYMAKQQYAAAAASCSSALHLQPDNVKGLVRRAKCFSHMHEYEMASEDLARVSELDPNNKQAKEAQAKLVKIRSSSKRSETDTFAKMFQAAPVST